MIKIKSRENKLPWIFQFQLNLRSMCRRQVSYIIRRNRSAGTIRRHNHPVTSFTAGTEKKLPKRERMLYNVLANHLGLLFGKDGI